MDIIMKIKTKKRIQVIGIVISLFSGTGLIPLLTVAYFSENNLIEKLCIFFFIILFFSFGLILFTEEN